MGGAATQGAMNYALLLRCSYSQEILRRNNNIIGHYLTPTRLLFSFTVSEEIIKLQSLCSNKLGISSFIILISDFFWTRMQFFCPKNICIKLTGINGCSSNLSTSKIKISIINVMCDPHFQQSHLNLLMLTMA